MPFDMPLTTYDYVHEQARGRVMGMFVGKIDCDIQCQVMDRVTFLDRVMIRDNVNNLMVRIISNQVMNCFLE